MMSDLEIAQRARMKPIAEIAAGLGIEDDELELYGKYKAKVALSIVKRLAARPQRQVHRRDGHHPDAARRGQDDDDHRALDGAQPRGLADHRGHPPAVAGARLRHQGRRGGGWLRPGRPHGGLQPPSDRRRPRDLPRPQPARRDDRQLDHPRQQAPHRPAVHHLAARRRRERQGLAQGRDRPRRAGERLAARDGLRHRGGLARSWRSSASPRA